MVTSMLEKAIEIEGLLRIIRDGHPLPETYRLLRMKTRQLAEAASGAEIQENSAEPAATHVDDAEHADFVMASPAPEPASTPEVIFANDKAFSKEGPATDALEIRANATVEVSPMVAAEEDLELDEEDDIILTFDDPTDDETDSDFPVATADRKDDHPAEARPESEEPAQAHDEATLMTPAESEAKTEEYAETSSAENATPLSVQPTRTKGKLKSAFSLNDRFLYARELFNGNMKMFDSTLEFLEGIDDYPVIEEYFFNELGWNAEKPFVADFMEIIRGKGV